MLKGPPPSALPLTCTLSALAGLALAMAVLALRGEQVLGTTLHPTTLLVVHLVTVGFLVPVVTGATWLVMPLAFGVPLPAGGLAWSGALLILVGGWGVASHFVFGGYLGVALAGALILAGALVPALLVLRGLRAARTPALLRVPISMAWVALLLAALWGILLAFDRDRPFLPGGHQAALAGHAHLAAVGFALTMFVGIGYRLLPMVLPGRPPAGWPAWLPVLALGPGALLFALCATLGWQAAARACAIAIALGLLVFAGIVSRLARDGPPPPRGRPSPDLPGWQVRLAMLWLALTTLLGLWIAFGDRHEPALLLAYGCAALLGFFATAVLALLPRLFAWFAWQHAWRQSDGSRPPALPAHALGSRALQSGVLAGCFAGCPLAFGGCLSGDPLLLRAGAVLVGLATLAAALDLRHVWRAAHAGARSAMAPAGPAG